MRHFLLFLYLCCIFVLLLLFFFFTDPATTEIYTLSLHDALPIWQHITTLLLTLFFRYMRPLIDAGFVYKTRVEDRKSTRLNSSHPSISYAVFCLKKKKKTQIATIHIGQPCTRNSPLLSPTQHPNQ